MTDDLGWVGLGVRPDFTGFPSALSRGVSGPLDRAGREGGNKLVSGMRSSVRRGVGSIVAPLAGAFGAYQIFNFARDSAAEARESIKVGALTASTLKATGGAANVTQKQIERLSGAMSAKIGVDDEAIQTSANLLLTFKNVANQGKHSSAIFNRAVRDSQDISAEGFGSTESASKMLGKALNDPVKGMSALTRAGVTFTQQQIDQVKALVASGDTLKAQKIILKEVEGQVGGAAEAQADSFDKLGVVVGNVKEDIGLAFMPVADDLADYLARRGPAAGKKFADFLRDDAIPQIKNFADEARPLGEEVLPAVGTVLGDVRDILKEAAPYAKDLVGAFNDMPDWAKKGVAVGGLSLLAASKTGLIGGKNGKGGAVSSLISGAPGSLRNPLYVIQVGGAGGGIPGTPGAKPKGPLGKAAAAASPFALGAETAFGFWLVDKYGATDGSKSAAGNAAGGYAGDGGMSLPDGNLNQTFPDDNAWNSFLRKVLGKDPYVSPEEQAARDAHSTASLDELLLGPMGKRTRKKIEAQYDILGLVEAKAKVLTFRQDAEKPIQVPIVAKIDKAIQDLFSTAFGGSDPLDDLLLGPTSGGRGRQRSGAGRLGGINVYGGMHVQAHDYDDFQRQSQRRLQQANLGGRP